jgi:hypothetical protein
MATKKPPAPRFVLWGWRRDGAYGPIPVKLTSGTLRHCRTEQVARGREGIGWVLGTYAEFDVPAGLRMHVAQIKGEIK